MNGTLNATLQLEVKEEDVTRSSSIYESIQNFFMENVSRHWNAGEPASVKVYNAIVQYNGEITSFLIHTAIILLFALTALGIIGTGLTGLNEFERRSSISKNIRQLPFALLFTVFHLTPVNIFALPSLGVYTDFTKTLFPLLKEVFPCLIFILLLTIMIIALVWLQRVVDWASLFNYKLTLRISLYAHILHFIERAVFSQEWSNTLFFETPIFLGIFAMNAIACYCACKVAQYIWLVLESKEKDGDDDV